MALIVQFDEVAAAKNALHRPVVCGYRSFNHGGEPILQLDTYGSSDRQIPDKTSQSIQLDRRGAEELVRLIRGTFGDL